MSTTSNDHFSRKVILCTHPNRIVFLVFAGKSIARRDSQTRSKDLQNLSKNCHNSSDLEVGFYRQLFHPAKW